MGVFLYGTKWASTCAELSSSTLKKRKGKNRNVNLCNTIQAMYLRGDVGTASSSFLVVGQKSFQNLKTLAVLLPERLSKVT